MVRVCLAGIVLIGLTGLFGCDEMDKDRVIVKTNAIYKNVKIVLTDQMVWEKLGDEKKEQLRIVERVYLEATTRLADVDSLDGADGKEVLREIVACCEILLGVIEGLEVGEEYGDVIDVVRLGVRVLKINLGG